MKYLFRMTGCAPSYLTLEDINDLRDEVVDSLTELELVRIMYIITYYISYITDHYLMRDKYDCLRLSMESLYKVAL